MQLVLGATFGGRKRRRKGFNLTVGFFTGDDKVVIVQPHNLKVVGSNPTPATNFVTLIGTRALIERRFCFCRYRQDTGKAAVKVGRQGFPAISDDRAQFNPVNELANDLRRLHSAPGFRQSRAQIRYLRPVIFGHVRVETNT